MPVDRTYVTVTVTKVLSTSTCGTSLGKSLINLRTRISLCTTDLNTAH